MEDAETLKSLLLQSLTPEQRFVLLAADVRDSARRESTGTSVGTESSLTLDD